MVDESQIELKIAFIDTELDDDEREVLAHRFLAELKQMEELEAVGRVPDPSPPDKSKGLGFLPGWLAAQVTQENAGKALGYVKDRLGGKAIEITVKGNGRELTVKAYSREEMDAAVQAAKSFLGE